MKPYLERLTDRLARASFPAEVTVTHEIDEGTLPREDGVAVGLFLNEALANCAKYAFPDGRKGQLSVRFQMLPQGWSLCVQDDGAGMATPDSPHSTGLGQQLMRAFAHQAGAQHRIEINETGCKTTLSRGLEEAESCS